MKPVIFLSVFMITLSMISCGTSEKLDSEPIEQTQTSDSTEYELVVFDAGFETWFQQRSQPAWYHSKPFYKSWNQRFTDRWNALVRTGRPGYDTEINYNPAIDYDLELEHKLYYFFKYNGFE